MADEPPPAYKLIVDWSAILKMVDRPMINVYAAPPPPFMRAHPPFTKSSFCRKSASVSWKHASGCSVAYPCHCKSVPTEAENKIEKCLMCGFLAQERHSCNKHHSNHRMKLCVHEDFDVAMGPAVRIRHRSHQFASQPSHFVGRTGWQAKMASIEMWTPWRNAHGPQCVWRLGHDSWHRSNFSGKVESHSDMHTYLCQSKECPKEGHLLFINLYLSDLQDVARATSRAWLPSLSLQTVLRCTVLLNKTTGRSGRCCINCPAGGLYCYTAQRFVHVWGKTVSMLLDIPGNTSNAASPSGSKLAVYCNRLPIKSVSQARLLGVTKKDNLSWAAHIDALQVKIGRKMEYSEELPDNISCAARRMFLRCRSSILILM